MPRAQNVPTVNFSDSITQYDVLPLPTKEYQNTINLTNVTTVITLTA